MQNEARIAEETKTTERQLWREHSRELSTELKTVSKYCNGVRHIQENVYFKNYWIWQLVLLDGVVDMDVGYKASDPGSKHHTGVFLFHFYITP